MTSECNDLVTVGIAAFSLALALIMIVVFKVSK